MLPSILVLASALIVLTLGLLHLVLTFSGPKFNARDRELQARMEVVSPVLTTQTTMWKAWIGFNASHSFGAILFGAVFGYLALVHSALLFHSVYLASVGGLLLLGYVFLGAKYWFSVPFRGVCLASLCYAAGFALSLASR